MAITAACQTILGSDVPSPPKNVLPLPLLVLISHYSKSIPVELGEGFSCGGGEWRPC